MRRSQRPRTFGLEITIGLATIVILGVVFLPRVHDLGKSTPIDPCLFNLMWIQRAKVEWARAKGQPPEAVPEVSDIAPFITALEPRWDGVIYRSEGRNRPDTNALPVSGIGCKFTIGSITSPPACSVHTNRWSQEVYFRNYGGN